MTTTTECLCTKAEDLVNQLLKQVALVRYLIKTFVFFLSDEGNLSEHLFPSATEAVEAFDCADNSFTTITTLLSDLQSELIQVQAEQSSFEDEGDETPAMEEVKLE